jgi:hypothetical protein
MACNKPKLVDYRQAGNELRQFIPFLNIVPSAGRIVSK